MAQRRIILVSVVCFSLTVFTVQTLPRMSNSNRTTRAADAERLRNMTEEESEKEIEKKREQRKLYLERLRNMTVEERKRELAKRRRQWELEREQRRKESKKKLDEIRRRQKERKESWEKAKEEAGGFIHEKYALGATEEQWKVIKPKLEKVRHLRDLGRSTVGLSLTSSSGSGARTRDSRSRSVPSWQWRISWEDKVPGELTEAQKIANALMKLVDSKNTKAEEFRRKMDDLRESRRRQENLKKQLSEARQELREVLTTRQEAALVLKHWL